MSAPVLRRLRREGFPDPTSINGCQLFLRSDVGVLADGAAQFTAANKEYLQIADIDSDFDLQDGDWTISGWAYLDTKTTDNNLLTQWDTGQRAVAIAYDTSSDDFSVYYSDDGSASPQVFCGLSSVSTAKWYMVVVRFEAGVGIRIRARASDAASWTEATNTSQTSIHNSSSSIVLGSSNTAATSTSHLDGRLDSWFVTKRLTTDAEDDWLYNSGKGRVWDDIEAGAGDGASLNDSNLKAWWDLGEGDGEQRLDSKGSNHLTSVGDEMVTNGGFDTDSDWTKNSWTISGGAANSPAANSTDLRQGGITFSASTQYTTVFTLVRTAGTIRIEVGGGAGSFRSSSDTFTEVVSTAASPSTVIDFDPNTTYEGTLDNVSVKVTNPVTRVDGIAGGAASDVNFATSFNGTTQYLNLPAKNLLNADESIAYADASGEWLAGGGASAIDRIVIADEGLPTDGLPSGIKTAYKLTISSSSNIFQNTAYVLANTNKHFFSLYVLVDSSYDGTGLNTDFTGYTSSTEANAVAASISTTTWQRTSKSIVADAGDLSGTLQVTQDGSPSTGTIYITAVQVVEEASLTAWDPNALFSPGGQDFWVSAWVRPDVISKDMSIMARYATSNQEWILYQDAANKFRFRTSSVGTTLTSDAQATTVPAAETWFHVFAYHEQGVGVGISVNGETIVTSAEIGGVFQGTKDTQIGNWELSDEDWDGRIDAVMFGSQAHGWAIGTTTPAALVAALFNNGQGLKTADLTAAQKSSYGLVTGFDLEDDFTDDNSLAITLTNNGSLTAGDAQGANYIAGLVATWQDQSGNGNHVEQTDIDKRPQLQSNYFGTKPGIKFDNIDDFLESTALFDTDIFTIIALFRNNGADGLEGIIEWTESGTGANRKGMSMNTTQYFCVGSSDGKQVNIGRDIDDDLDHIVVVGSDGAGNTNVILRDDGDSWTPSAEAGSSAGTADKLYIGDTTRGIDKLNGHIAYIAVYNRLLPINEIIDAENWMHQETGSTIL